MRGREGHPGRTRGTKAAWLRRQSGSDYTRSEPRATCPGSPCDLQQQPAAILAPTGTAQMCYLRPHLQPRPRGLHSHAHSPTAEAQGRAGEVLIGKEGAVCHLVIRDLSAKAVAQGLRGKATVRPPTQSCASPKAASPNSSPLTAFLKCHSKDGTW